MKWKLFYSFCILTLASTVMASEELSKSFQRASNSFAVELYQKTIEGKSGNVIISPASVQSALSLALFGAGGETKAEMLRGLKYENSLNDQQIAQNFEDFSEQVRKTSGLSIANKIYVMTGYTPKETFKNFAVKSFNSEAQNLNFGNNVESANTINQWVEEKTNNKIKDLISSDSLDGLTRMVLVNAIYFKGFWTHQFNKDRTRQKPFYLNDVDSVNTDFMYLKEHFRYGVNQELDASILELPYKDSNISMLIILPNKRTGLAQVESKLNSVDLSEISKKLRKTEVVLELPKFKIEFDIKLNEPLQKMGMSQMFNEARADFSNLLVESEQLAVSEVVHKAFIEVNEEGAEAAAATAILVGFRSARRDEEEFFANHPFLFIIKDQNTNLFTGRISKF